MQDTPDFESFDDPGPLAPQPPGRARRIATIAILVALIVSIVFLAFVSGRGVITVAPVGTDRPAPSPAAPVARLAVVDAAGRLTTIDLSGNATPLGDAGVAYSFPVWSPTGDRVAAIGKDGARGGVYVMAAAPTTGAVGQPPVYASADQPPFYISWSPDGQGVGFLTREDDSLALRAAPADGSAPAAIVRHGSPMYWAWIPAGGMLVHSGGEAPDAFVGEVDATGASLEQTALAPGGFRAPAISADGTFRAYVGPGETTSDQIVVERRDGTGRRVADVHGAAAIGFGPAASDLAFIAPDRPGREVAVPLGPLRVLDATTGDVRVILNGLVVAFYWSPDGRTIAALEFAQGPDDTVVDVGRPGTATLARARTATAAPGVAFELVFVDPATGAVVSQRLVHVGELFAAQVLPYFDQYAASHRMWSPDGRSVALPLVDPDGTPAIVVIPADGGATSRVADGVAAAWGP